jgi:beta-N-acetylhexosaminidase
VKRFWNRVVFLQLILLFSCFSCEKHDAAGAVQVVEGGGDTLVENDREIGEAAQAIVQAMTDGQLAAQVIMTGIDAEGPLSEGEKKRLRDTPVGAVMLFGKNLDGKKQNVKIMTDELVSLVSAESLVPFIAVDHEGGAVHRWTDEVERLPAPLDYWELSKEKGTKAALDRIKQDARRSAAEINALGVTMNLAPVAEPLTDENGAFLATRSYGPDMDFVVGAAGAFVQGMKESGVVCAIKHFPGNGALDPHLRAPLFQGDETFLRNAVQPFRVLIQNDSPAALMVSHVIVPAWDDAHNASLSEIVIRKIRDELGFEGIILADDFSMGAVSGDYNTENIIVLALSRGVDMVMAWPRNLPSIHAAILAALKNGDLSRDRLREAARRIVAEKIRAGLPVLE